MLDDNDNVTYFIEWRLLTVWIIPIWSLALITEMMIDYVAYCIATQKQTNKQNKTNNKQNKKQKHNKTRNKNKNKTKTVISLLSKTCFCPIIFLFSSFFFSCLEEFTEVNFVVYCSGIFSCSLIPNR